MAEAAARPVADRVPRVLYSDTHLLVVDKPTGMTVIPGRGETLDDCLRGWLERVLDAPLWVVHRIDRDTSGLVVFARDPDTHRHLCGQFERHEIRKTYWALASATLPAEGRIDLPLHPARKGKMRPARPGEAGAIAAHSSYQRLQRIDGDRPITVLEVALHTGRQHQIRVHLRALDAPLHGDALYGSATLHGPDPAPRLALHAWKLEFVHPQSGERLQLVAPLPADLLDWLARHAPGSQTD